MQESLCQGICHDKLEQAVFKAAPEMSREARSELAHQLLATLSDDEQAAVGQAWIAEIRRRIKQIDDGEPLLDGDEVMRQARDLIRK